MILYRPTGLDELKLVAASGWIAWPPRLPDQPIFYPVLTLEYARKIARDWNAVHSPGHIGFVTRFEITEQCAARYPVQLAGGRSHGELWVPAEELDEFNTQIVGKIEVIESHPGTKYAGVIDPKSHLPSDFGVPHVPSANTMSPRLNLVDGNLELLTAAVAARAELEALLGVSVAEGWAGFPEALPILLASYAKHPNGHAWGSLFFVDPQVRTLVGFGGFKGAPSADGVVEIGYAIAPAFQGRGLATDAAAQMVRRAFADASVNAVDAHTLGHANASTRVLEKSGFQKIGEANDPDDGTVWHWRRERPAS